MSLDPDGLPDEETLNLLLLLRGTFPHGDISYAPAIRAWIARRRSQTLCQNSPALLAIALILIERRARWPLTMSSKRWAPPGPRAGPKPEPPDLAQLPCSPGAPRGRP